MKVVISIFFMTLFFSASSFAGGGFDCRDDYNKFLKTSKSWGTDADYKQFMASQSLVGKKVLAKTRFNKATYLQWKRMLYVKASDLIRESYSRMSTPLVDRIASKGNIPKKYIFHFIREGNKSKSFCDNRMMDFNEIAVAIVLSYKIK